MKKLVLLLAACLLAACGQADSPGESGGQYQRVVTLAPHLAELVYAVGGEARLVGVSAFSDFPEAVTTLPVVSDAFTVDQEQLALLKPDLLLAWESGMPASTIGEIRSMGFPVEVIRTRGLSDIADALRRIGRLTGRADAGEAAAGRFESELAAIAAAHERKLRLRVFLQISSRPLYTVNREHYISELLSLCGGENVFAELEELAPSVDVEAVVDRQPEAILSSSGSDVAALWGRWESVPAVSAGNIFSLPPDETGRPTPRVLVAARAACRALDEARTRLDRA